MFYSAKHVVFTSYNGDRTFEKGKSACLNQEIVFFLPPDMIFSTSKNGDALNIYGPFWMGEWTSTKSNSSLCGWRFELEYPLPSQTTFERMWSSLGTCSQPGNPEEHIIKYQSDNFQLFLGPSCLLQDAVFFFFEEYFELNPKARLPLLINVSLKADGRTPSGQSSLVKMQQGCPMNGPMNRAMFMGPFSRMHPLHFQVKLTNPKFLTSHFMVIWNWLLISQRFPKYISIEYIDCSPMITPVPVCWIWMDLIFHCEGYPSINTDIEGPWFPVRYISRGLSISFLLIDCSPLYIILYPTTTIVPMIPLDDIHFMPPKWGHPGKVLSVLSWCCRAQA